ncbi:MAG: hypothetical protein IIB33_01970, partial [Chloroflexi bacterium]|nr:hypothetical protein [Chloroflexota bacterium]
PHYNGATAGVPRKEEFQSMVSKYPELGIAVDNHCAIEFVDDGYRVITARPDVGAYRLFKGADGLVVERLEQAGRALWPH